MQKYTSKFTIKMRREQIVIIIALLQAHIVRVLPTPIVDTNCPSYCQCNLFENHNLANCSGKNLINPTLYLPETVQILDLSFNDISIVDNTCLMNYSHLQILNVSHNALFTIYPDAFNMLLRVRSIDISFNRLQDLDEHLIETNRYLMDLNLEGNKFMLQSQRRLLLSNFLRSLNLRNSQLYFVDDMMFVGLPQLENLDLSQNLLVTINMAAFLILPKLSFLDLTGNRWMCHDPKMLQELERLRQQHMNITLRYCELTTPEDDSNMLDFDYENLNISFHELDSSSKLSKLVNIDAIGTGATQWHNLEAVREQFQNENEIDLNNSDETDNDELYDEYSDYTSMPIRCQKVCESELYELREAYGYKLNKIRELLAQKFGTQEFNEYENKKSYTFMEEYHLMLAISFGFGCVMGIVIALSVYGCATCINKQCSYKSRSSQCRNIVERSSPPEQAVQEQPRNTVPRRQIRIRINNPSVASDIQPNFVARLFGKTTQYNSVPIYQNHTSADNSRNYLSETPPPIYQSTTTLNK